MKITSLRVINFRGIQRVDMQELGDTIIVAGQNGSGKSCLFDAIRLLKSVYGGYQQNEWQHFFTEFQIQLHGGAKNLNRLFNDITKDIEVGVEFRLRDHERSYITNNARDLLEETIWQAVLPEAFQFGGYRKALFSAQFRERQPEVSRRVTETLPQLQAELAQPSSSGSVLIKSSGEIEIKPSTLLSVVFTTYRPRQIGVIDFHGAQRHYGREDVQGINLNLDQISQAQSQSSLYNYNNKYNNVKSEMAGNYVKELLAQRAEATLEEGPISLAKTMQELFASFFPDKAFLGPQATKDGSLSFPVRTQGNTIHDLDELSSGEKEILYGYLRIRSSAPRDSIILLDEPELHLNPRLIRGLPEFYRRHLGEALQNQLWLVTHSDALIREAVGKPGFNVYHMLPCGAVSSGSPQMRELIATKDLDLVMSDLVGDLAAYRPGGKGVIFEGGGDSDFDKTMTLTLFNEELRGTNLISGSNKTKVKALHEVLERAYLKGDLPTKFYAIVDRDSEQPAPSAAGVTQFAWDVYHIENYLLEPKYVAETFNSFLLEASMTEEAALEKLEKAARHVVSASLIHQLTDYANKRLISCLNFGFNPETLTISADLASAIDRSIRRVDALALSDLSSIALSAKESELRNEIESSFASGTWRARLPGRDILRQFVRNEKIATNYEAFRNQLLSRMAASGFKPHGMKNIIHEISAG